MDQIEFKVDMKLPDMTVVDFTQDIVSMVGGGVGRIRSSLNPLSRETEISLASILADNGQGHFAPAHANSIWGTNLYQGSRIRLYSRWRTTQGSVTAWESAFIGVLDRVSLDSGRKTAELKVVDALNKLRNLSVPEDQEDDLLADDTPAHQALKIIGLGFGNVESEFIDTDSFGAAHTVESSASMTMKYTKLKAGTWFSNLKLVLDHGGSAVRVGRDGKIRYFTWLPDLTTPTIKLRRGENMIALTGGDQFQDIRNAVKAQKGNGANPPVASASSGSPRKVATSISFWGERFESTMSLVHFDSSSPVNLSADRRINLLALPPLFHRAVCHMSPELFPFEPFQRVAVYDETLGYSNKAFTVIEVDAEPSSQQVTFTLWDNAIADDPWLICNRSGHKLDVSYRVW